MDGRLRLDNNLCENVVRNFGMSHKIWLFAASVDEANASANLYIIVETAKANGHESRNYIQHVLTHLPPAQSLDEVEALLPFNVRPGKYKAS